MVSFPFCFLQPGDKVMILPTVDDVKANELFPTIDRVGMPSGLNYVRTTTDY